MPIGSMVLEDWHLHRNPIFMAQFCRFLYDPAPWIRHGIDYSHFYLNWTLSAGGPNLSGCVPCVCAFGWLKTPLPPLERILKDPLCHPQSQVPQAITWVCCEVGDVYVFFSISRHPPLGIVMEFTCFFFFLRPFKQIQDRFVDDTSRLSAGNSIYWYLHPFFSW